MLPTLSYRYQVILITGVGVVQDDMGQELVGDVTSWNVLFLFSKNINITVA